MRLFPYTDFEDALDSCPACFSGVKGEELRLTGTVVVAACCRGEGVRGIRPPAVREQKSPLWDLIGVEIDAVAMMVKFSP
jgi:hypothetical protein